MQIDLKILTGNPWLSLAAGLVSFVAAYFINKVLKRWVQYYRDMRQKTEVGTAKEGARTAAEIAQAESDRLKDLDGR